MSRISIEAKTENEKLVLSYLNENASDDLVTRINAGTKTLSQCWSYITHEARKQAEHGCACIPDAIVFGWAIHFFEEDDINGEEYNKTKTVKTAHSEEKSEPTVDVVPVVKPKKKKVTDDGLNQISFDDLFGGY